MNATAQMVTTTQVGCGQEIGAVAPQQLTTGEWECPDCHTRKPITDEWPVERKKIEELHKILGKKRTEIKLLRQQLTEAHAIALKLQEHYPSAKGVSELITICQPKR